MQNSYEYQPATGHSKQPGEATKCRSFIPLTIPLQAHFQESTHEAYEHNEN